MKNFLIVLLVFMNSLFGLYGQMKTVSGKVISDQFDVLIGVSIKINDTVTVGKTDIDGEFQIDIPVSENKIMFKGFGLEPTSIELIDECERIEVVIMLSGTYDFRTPRQVERKRKKRYKKLTEIHKQAFEKGIFRTDYCCCKREFESLYLTDPER